ncbi:DUF5994 family protein [Streptomyces pseudovenezuelae]|uniref:Uncharacterized protein n=1 Tax=Streptomyces pseudovenezuelae TaxID=67350 RepID=A0ABT6LFY2_9ACTN|nr:DUF5994 family protein [Streptomyces pseudovenezuelae]MDH6215208.1 hypothetical protein [Streptomyces pseudovenezuelae]
MSASTPQSPLRAVPFRAPLARLALKSESRSGGPVELDGAWWPRTRDLASELSVLAEVLDPLWGRITRIAVNPRNWPILPPRIFVNGHVVKVGWFASELLDPDQILLLSYTAGRWDLLVVPPETDAPVAARLMAAASADTGPALTASALMAMEGASSKSPDPEVGGPEDWGVASETAVAVALAVPVPSYGRNQHRAVGM